MGNRIILNHIKERIKEMDSMQGLLSCYRLYKYPQYRKWVEEYNNHNVFQFSEFGQLNKDKLIYMINDTYPSSGLFWCWRQVIRGLMVAERYGFVPVVDWTNTPYYLSGGINGVENPFEYYFEPVSDISLKEARQSYNVTFYTRQSDGMPDMGYNHKIEMDQMDSFTEINSRYIKIKKEIFSEINDKILETLNGEKTLGVHVRGVEWGKISGHPIPVSLEFYTQIIDQAILQNGFKKIFLATDSEDTVSHFVKRYGAMVVYYEDVIRTSKGGKTLVIFDSGIKRENNPYWLGYEVLKDMLTLSRCNGLVAGFSHVSLAAEVFKKGYGEEYMFKKLVNQEIRQSGISPLKATSKMKRNQWR